MTEEPHAVPEYEAVVLGEKTSRSVLIIPVLNEGQRIARQLERMRPWRSRVDIVIADGGSTDGSVDPGKSGLPGVRAVLVKKGPGKLSAQMRMAISWSLGEGYESLIFMDGNDKDDPSAIPRFLEALEGGGDHVQGSRYIPGGVETNTPFLRKWGVRLLHAPLISLAAGFRYTDTTNGFRAYSRRLLEDPRVLPLREVFSQYELHYYLAIRAARLGFRTVEVPVGRAYPRRGRIPTKISAVRGNLLILKTLVAACLGRFNPK